MYLVSSVITFDDVAGAMTSLPGVAIRIPSFLSRAVKNFVYMKNKLYFEGRNFHRI